ncbi:MAG: exo-alpha-sialidase [Firmicutes bacterium]|nr:exo-alpha-sialidase [Bacillota bacterium]
MLVKTGPQSLAVIYRTGGTHVSISATLAVSTSSDGGKSWSDPVEIYPRWEDVRNPAFGVNSRGELVAAFWKGKQCYEVADGEAKGFSIKYAKKGDFTFTTISSDGGKTWSKPTPLNIENLRLISPYGRIITAPDGTLLMSVYGVPAGDDEAKDNVVYLIRSRDGGRTWGNESVVAHDYNETSFAFMPDGTLIAAARNWSKGQFVSILFSKDMGYTWSEPKQVTRNSEHPADLTLLQSGKLLLTFGRRVRPMGCGALISEDGGKTWRHDKEILLAGDGIENGDLGYPSTVQLDDGTIVTVLYYASGSEMAKGTCGWGDVSCQAIHYREEDIAF